MLVLGGFEALGSAMGVVLVGTALAIAAPAAGVTVVALLLQAVPVALAALRFCCRG